MNLGQLQHIINETLRLHPESGGDTVMVRVFDPGKVGPSPCTPVRSAGAGFDWDKGTFLIFPEPEVQVLTEDLKRKVIEDYKVKMKALEKELKKSKN